MARVTGIGGIFYKVENPEVTRSWYADKLGVPVQNGCWVIESRDVGNPDQLRHTVWSPFPEDTRYFLPSDKPFMVNLRVDDLDGMLERLRSQGIDQVGGIIEDENGRFGYVVDPDGVKIELWQPAS
jgi:catechol 2,3-dioxygenase-like lactoylglutathione lyase family enzyme